MRGYKPVLNIITIKCIYCGRERVIKTTEEDDGEILGTCIFDLMPMLKKIETKKYAKRKRKVKSL